MIKAVFFDIDGTLVSFKTHKVPESTIEAIDILHKEGIQVFIASGRHLSAINNLGDLKFDGYVTVNGAVTYYQNNVIDRHPLPVNVPYVMARLTKERHMACCYVLDEGIVCNFFNEKTDELFKLLNFPIPPLVDLNDVACKNVYQLIAFFSQEQEDEILEQLNGCDSQRWHPIFTDIVPRGVSKVMGIEAIAKKSGITREEIAAFGDGGNDTEMLSYVGCGIAMGNADENVKKYAKHVTTSVDEDGILNAVKHIILNNGN